MTLEVIVTRARGGEATKPPLVFVHGAWHGAWCWTEHFTEWFAERGYTSYAIDLRGHGASDGSLRSSRIAHYVTDVRKVVTHLDDDPILVGHSMGGFVVQHYMSIYPVRASVLIAPVPVTGVIGATMRVAARHPLAFLKTNATLSLGPIVENPERARSLLFGASIDDDVALGYAKRVQSESYLAYLEMIADLPRRSKVINPVLVIGGTEDAIFSTPELRLTAAAYEAELTMIEGSGHNVMLDVGWESAAERIDAWLGDLRTVNG